MSAPRRHHVSHLGLLAQRHRTHELRIERAAAVHRKRIAFVEPRPFRAGEAEQLVAAVGGVIVEQGDRPDVLVVSDTGALDSAVFADGWLVVDAEEFMHMVRAFAETHRSTALAGAVASARKELQTNRGRPTKQEDPTAALSRALAQVGGLRVRDRKGKG